MKIVAGFVGCAILAASGLVHAAIVSGSTTSYAYTYGQDFPTWVYKSDPSGTTHLQFSNPPSEAAQHGLDLDIDALAGGDRIRIDHRVAYQPVYNDNFYSRADAALSYNNGVDGVGGFIRVKVDYTLDPEGPRSAGVVRLQGETTHLDASGTKIWYTPLNLEAWLKDEGDGSDAVLSGSLVSEWLPFASVADLRAYNGDIERSISWTASLTTFIDTYEAASANGGLLNSHADLRVSYEIMPIPEPETYATLLAGLAMTAVALRRRSKHGA